VNMVKVDFRARMVKILEAARNKELR
jgi:hypothetical protein